MKTTWLTRALTLGLTVGILTAPTLATAATKTMTGPVTKTPETRNSVKGNATEYIEYTYTDVYQRVKEVGGYANLSDADYRAIADGLKNVNGLTDEQIRVKVEEVRIQRAREAVIAQWRRDHGEEQLSTYSQVGHLAIDLARDLAAIGGYPAATIYFDGKNGGGSAALNWALSHEPWHLQPTMWHNAEFAPAGSTINEQAFLDAFTVVIQNAWAHGWSLVDPLVLDLNGNGKVDVTGKSSAKFRVKSNEVFIAEGSVAFDMRGTGKAIRTEWIKGGDGFLVDNRKNQALSLVKQGKPLTIANLFGDDVQLSGFNKLTRLFDPNAKLANLGGAVSPELGRLKGQTLDDMLVWVDDGDGKATEKELFTPKSLGITEIALPARFVQNEAGEYLERATFTRNGKEFGIQEVWFAADDK